MLLAYHLYHWGAGKAWLCSRCWILWCPGWPCFKQDFCRFSCFVVVHVWSWPSIGDRCTTSASPFTWVWVFYVPLCCTVNVLLLMQECRTGRVKYIALAATKFEVYEHQESGCPWFVDFMSCYISYLCIVDTRCRHFMARAGSNTSIVYNYILFITTALPGFFFKINYNYTNQL